MVVNFAPPSKIFGISLNSMYTAPEAPKAKKYVDSTMEGRPRRNPKKVGSPEAIPKIPIWLYRLLASIAKAPTTSPSRNLWRPYATPGPIPRMASRKNQEMMPTEAATKNNDSLDPFPRREGKKSPM